MDRGAWHATVPGVTETQTRLKRFRARMHTRINQYLFSTNGVAGHRAGSGDTGEHSSIPRALPSLRVPGGNTTSSQHTIDRESSRPGPAM